MRNLQLSLTPSHVQIVAGALSAESRPVWEDGKRTDRFQDRDGKTLHFLDGVLVAYNGTNLDVQVSTTTPLADAAVGTQFRAEGEVELSLRGTVVNGFNGNSRAELVGSLFVERLTPVNAPKA